MILWEDIDNSLAEGLDEGAILVLENKKDVYKVRIAKNSNARSLVNIKKGIHEIGWNLIGGDNTKVVIEVPETVAPQESCHTKVETYRIRSFDQEYDLIGKALRQLKLSCLVPSTYEVVSCSSIKAVIDISGLNLGICEPKLHNV